MGGATAAPDRFTLTVPARSDLVVTMRVFASAVARHFQLGDELVEDVKLAVSEACTGPVEAGAGGALSLAIAGDGSGIACEITSSAWTAAARTDAGDLPEGVDAGVLDRLQLVRALFGDAERSEAGGEVRVRFSTGSRPPG